jgi:hypothetical protein
MKLCANKRSHQTGVALIECLVYIAVFALLMGGGTTAFYFCWDHTRAVIFTTNEIQSALTAGETWRADVRAASGKISIQTTTTSETVTIPEGSKNVVYRFADGQLFREIPAQNHSRVLLDRVKASEITSAARDGVDAWRWELEIQPRRKETHLPLLFTFEAAQTKP